MYDKIKAIMNFKEPTNAKEVRRFLGLVNFLSRFIYNLSSETAILRKFTQKDIKSKWGPEDRTAFNRFKNLAINSSALSNFNQSYEILYF